MTTKDKILQVARKLFNKYGTEKITTRHIASEIGISQGNLHYHYPNKDKVIIAIFIAFVSEMDRVPQEESIKEPTILDLFEDLRHDFNLLLKFKFLFQDQMVVWRRVPEIEKQFKKMFDKRRWEFENLVMVLTHKNLVRKDIPLSQFEALFFHISILTSSWLQHIDLFGTFKTKEQQLDHVIDKIFRIWWPYLTSKGIIAFEKVTAVPEKEGQY